MTRVRDLSFVAFELSAVLGLAGNVDVENGPPDRLGHAKLAHHMLDTGTAAGGAYQFPEAASLRISFSIVRSETARRSCLFSDSSSLSRLT